MIQRIQTVYLFISALITAITIVLGLTILVSSWVYAKGTIIEKLSYIYPYLLFLILGVLSAVLAFITIFSFKNRQRQIKLCKIQILLNIGGCVVAAVMTRSLLLAIFYGSVVVVSLINIVLVYLAFRSIKKDEALVKMMDRLR